ncbi:MAG: 50S ribosomal protein L10 [Acidimicrobiales bacterium]
MATSVDAGIRQPRPEKVAVVDEVRERLSSANAAILTEYRGLSVSGMETLRRQIYQAGGDYKVYKNTLVRRAAHENGLDGLDPLLEGPTAIAFVREDVATVAKVLRDFARTHPSLVVKGGLVGTSLLDARTTASLAELPSREVLLAQVAGAFAAPMQWFAALLAAVPQKMAYALSALIEARGGAEDTAAVAEDTAAVAEDTAAVAEDTGGTA